MIVSDKTFGTITQVSSICIVFLLSVYLLSRYKHLFWIIVTTKLKLVAMHYSQ